MIHKNKYAFNYSITSFSLGVLTYYSHPSKPTKQYMYHPSFEGLLIVFCEFSVGVCQLGKKWEIGMFVELSLGKGFISALGVISSTSWVV